MRDARVERLRRGLELALNQEWAGLNRACRRAAKLPIERIATPSACNRRIVATVAADGGEARLSLEPIRSDVIRVADSDGTTHFEQFVPQSLRPDEIIRHCIAGEERLQRLLAYLGLEQRDLLPRTDSQKGNLVATLRELMEWGATLKLASEKQPKLIVRDGLLRSILLPSRVFQALRDKLSVLTAKNGHLLVGIAKRSAVISYLSVAFGIQNLFADGDPAYLTVGAELEREASPSQYRWMEERCMGRLHIARLDRGESVPLLPVDIADWQTDGTAEIMMLLGQSARASFPIRGYPQELKAAHEHARLSDFEAQMLEGLLLEQLAERSKTVADQVRQLKLLGRRIVEGFQNEHGSA